MKIQYYTPDQNPIRADNGLREISIACKQILASNPVRFALTSLFINFTYYVKIRELHLKQFFVCLINEKRRGGKPTKLV